MPIILDQFDSKGYERKIVFSLNSQGSQALVLPANTGINFLIQAEESFTLEKSYEILSVTSEKKINDLSITDGVSTVFYSNSIKEDDDYFSIVPDSNIPLVKRVFNSLKKISIEPHTLKAESRLRSVPLSLLGIGANPTIVWNFDFQFSFLFRIK